MKKLVILWILVIFLVTTSTSAAVFKNRADDCGFPNFSCSNGVCISHELVCDGKSDCIDSSDEGDCFLSRDRDAEEPVLHRLRRETDSSLLATLEKVVTWQPPWLRKSFWVSDNTTTPKPPPCILPEYPDHGSYTANQPQAWPGQEYDFVTVKFTCRPGYALEGVADVYCLQGAWQHPPPRCILQCQLNLNVTGIEFNCQIPHSNGGYRPCKELEPDGTIAEAKCRKHFYSPYTLPTMHCIGGNWDFIHHCVQDCGKVTPEGSQLVSGGESAKHGELPWHVGIYTKTKKPYMQICGGSIVSKTLVLSAAHCFWDDATHLKDAKWFAVAAGKIYRNFNEPHDKDAQKTDVSNIIVPEKYFGSETNFDYDLALVFVTTPFEYKNFIGPVCVSFNLVLEAEQLRAGNYGKVAGWGFTGPNGAASQVLKVVDLPYMDEGTCLVRAPPGYRDLVTSQKFCAASEGGKAVCKGDSGGGLVFASKELGVLRYYLRGIVSTAPQGYDKCDTTTITTFSHLTKMESYIRPHLSL